MTSSALAVCKASYDCGCMYRAYDDCCLYGLPCVAVVAEPRGIRSPELCSLTGLVPRVSSNRSRVCRARTESQLSKSPSGFIAKPQAKSSRTAVRTYHSMSAALLDFRHR